MGEGLVGNYACPLQVEWLKLHGDPHYCYTSSMPKFYLISTITVTVGERGLSSSHFPRLFSEGIWRIARSALSLPLTLPFTPTRIVSALYRPHYPSFYFL